VPLTPGKTSRSRKKSCPKPNTFDNAAIQPKYQIKEIFKHRETIGYKCLPDFVKEGKLFQKCHDGQWTNIKGSCKLKSNILGNIYSQIPFQNSIFCLVPPILLFVDHVPLIMEWCLSENTALKFPCLPPYALLRLGWIKTVLILCCKY
jgi:hypothetical protein